MQARVVIRNEYSVNSKTTRTLTINVPGNDGFHHEICIPNLECASYSKWMKFFNDSISIKIYSSDGDHASCMIWVGNRIRVVSQSSSKYHHTYSVEFNSEPFVTVLKQAIDELYQSKTL